MKLISLWEPWATLMAIGAKKIETRSWPTSYRGWLAIQAAKHFTAEEDDQCWMSPFREALQAGGIKDAPHRSGRRFQFPLGHIVAVVNLVACAPMEYCGNCDGCGWHEGGKTRCSKCGGCGIVPALHDLTENEAKFGTYEVGRWGWVTIRPFRLPVPIPFKAKQGLCSVDGATVELIRAQWKRAEATT